MKIEYVRRLLLLFWLAPVLVLCQTPFRHDLQFNTLASTWDEALPLGNGMVGNLVWQKDGKLRFSLDRADLWDLRPMTDIDKLSFKMIREQVAKNDYQVIQELGDVPYEREPAPSKIPGAALEFDVTALGEVSSTRLYIKQGIAEVTWKSGARLLTFIHPDLPVGWFRFERGQVTPSLVPPRYSGTNAGTGNSVEGQGLARLGYEQGTVSQNGNSFSYRQAGWNGFVYNVAVSWQKSDDGLEGTWAITSNSAYNGRKTEADVEVRTSLGRGFSTDLSSTKQWWNEFWTESSLAVPDSIIERQWYLENYKFGCIARPDAPPITLQAVWTADNGNLPPWKGDIHNDLNTQLSYWPSYSANHLPGASGFTHWLWDNKPVFEKYTSRFFGVEGLTVPGVTTLDGKDMGGWVQYSYSPTVGGWLAHHFYLEWRYSMDRTFLKEKAYPWIRGFAQFIERLAVKGNPDPHRDGRDGKLKLPLSSSPEFYDNSMKAWFKETTNYDLAIIRWTYLKAAEMAKELGLSAESDHWKKQLGQWPALSTDASGSLSLAPGIPYPESHRHFSHLMAIHPLGILNYHHPDDKKIIDGSMKLLEDKGTDYWVGYSFSWQANLYARMGNGAKAAEVLRKFATCFCLPNGFHVNGDQCEGKLSKFRYRPFTLEGNFAFASGLQEMLLQSQDGIVRVLPAVPEDWKNVSFRSFRTEGAFLVSANRVNGKIREVSVVSEKGGEFVMENPFSSIVIDGGELKTEGNLVRVKTRPGQGFTVRGGN